MATWTVNQTDEFCKWFEGLDEAAKEDICADRLFFEYLEDIENGSKKETRSKKGKSKKSH